MNEKKLKQFFEFRKQFTKLEWFELNHIIDGRLAEKADQLELDDQDLKIIEERLNLTKSIDSKVVLKSERISSHPKCDRLGNLL